MTPTVAVIDLGTVSTRLLVLGDDTEIRSATITRMGEGLSNEGRITSAAFGRVLDCLRVYKEIIDDSNVDSIRVVATSAARAASNRVELFEMVAEATGVEPELLSGEDEGRWSFAGAVSDLDHLGVALVVDVGGGSTEFAIGTTTGGVEHVFSADIGAESVTATYLTSDPPRADELSAGLSIIERHLADVERELPGLADALSSSGLVIGVGGTVTTMAAVEIGLIEYDRDAVHGFELTRDATEDVFRTLATESAAARRHNPGLAEERVELIVGGSCVVVETMRHFDIKRIRVSEHDLLDGVAAAMRASE